MSLLGSVGRFLAKEAAAPALEEFGRKVGTAVGQRLARRVDPKGPPPEDDQPDHVSEDERTA